MRLIDKVILKDLIGPFINGMFMFLLLVFTAGFLFQATTLLVQGVPPLTVLRFIVYVLPSIVTQTFPMAMLLASLLGFGRLSADKEAIAIFAAGVSFPRMIRGVLLMGIVVSLSAFAWNELVVPPCSRAAYKLKQDAVTTRAGQDKALALPVMSDDKSTVESFIKIDHGFDRRTKTAHGVTLIKYSKDPAHSGQAEVEVYCERALARSTSGLDWKYFNGSAKTTVWNKDTGKLESVQVLDFDTLDTLPGGAKMGKSLDELMSMQRIDNDTKSFRELRYDIRSDYANNHLADVKGKEVDLYGKIALPLASIIFGIVGAALGINTSRGASRTVGFGMALSIVFAYWVFYRAMWVAGASGSVPPMLAAFLADIVGLTLGLILALRASR